MSSYPNTGEVNSDHLVSVVFVCQISLGFVIKNYGDISELSIMFLINFHQLVLESSHLISDY